MGFTFVDGGRGARKCWEAKKRKRRFVCLDVNRHFIVSWHRTLFSTETRHGSRCTTASFFLMMGRERDIWKWSERIYGITCSGLYGPRMVAKRMFSISRKSSGWNQKVYEKKKKGERTSWNALWSFLLLLVIVLSMWWSCKVSSSL